MELPQRWGGPLGPVPRSNLDPVGRFGAEELQYLTYILKGHFSCRVKKNEEEKRMKRKG